MILAIGRTTDVQKCMLVCQSAVNTWAADQGTIFTILRDPHAAEPTRLFAWMVMGRTVDEFVVLYTAVLNGYEPITVVDDAGDFCAHLKDCESCSEGVIAGLTAIYEGRVLDVARMLGVLSEEVLTLQETEPIVVGVSPFVD